MLADQIGVRLRGRPSASADVPVESVNAERPGGGRYARYGLPTDWLEQRQAGRAARSAAGARGPRQGAGSGHNVRAYQVLGLVQQAAGRAAGGRAVRHDPLPRVHRGGGVLQRRARAVLLQQPAPRAVRRSADRHLAGLRAGRPAWRRGCRWGPAVTLALRTVAATPTYLGDVGRFQDIMVDSDVGVKTALAPHFGAGLRARRRHTRLAATVHTPAEDWRSAPTSASCWPTASSSGPPIRFTHAYLPWTLRPGGAAAGACGDGGRHAGGHRAATRCWSQLPRPARRAARTPAYAWYDTCPGVLGVRHRQRARRARFVDVAYQPSPVPDQTGRTQLRRQRPAGRQRPAVDLAAALAGRGSLRAGLQAQAAPAAAPRDQQAAPARRRRRRRWCSTRCPTTPWWAASRWPAARACRPTTPAGRASPAPAGSWVVR